MATGAVEAAAAAAVAPPPSDVGAGAARPSQRQQRMKKHRPTKNAEVGTPVTCCLGVLLLALVAAKAICGAILLTSSSSVKQRSGFADTVHDPSRRNNTLNPRMCVCDSQLSQKMDPLGRMGLRGSLTSERFCRQCWSANQVAGFRRKLARGSSLIPWAVWLLASPLLLLVFMPHLANWPKLQALTPRITTFALCTDVVLCALMGAFSLDWGAFKNLCINGHAFDEHYHVEVAFVDSLYFDVCAYSAVEERMLTSIGVVMVLDIIVIVIICYMRSSGLLHKPQSRQAHELLGRITALTDSSKAFDTRRKNAEVPPELLGQPQQGQQGNWGIGLSLMNFDFAHRRKRRDERRLNGGHLPLGKYGHPRGGSVDPAPAEKAPRRSGKRNPTHPWRKEKEARKRSQSPQPKGEASKHSKEKGPKGKPVNEFFAYARVIARSRGSHGGSDSEDSLDNLEPDKLLELFHPPVRKKPARRFL